MRADHPRDQFGLPVPRKEESAADRKYRKAVFRREVELVLGRLFAGMKANLGLREAQSILHNFAKSPSRGVRGSSDPVRDVKLLDLYDQHLEGAPDKPAALTALAERLHDSHPGKFGNSPSAIKKQVNRLAKKRELHRKNEAEFFNPKNWSGDPPSEC